MERHTRNFGVIFNKQSVFKRSLYIKSGGLDIKSNSGGDYFLWQKFAKKFLNLILFS